MMSKNIDRANDGAVITVAKISAVQGIAVALIGAVAGVISTIWVAGVREGEKPVIGHSFTVPQASGSSPSISYSWSRTDAESQNCMNTARDVLNEYGANGIQTTKYTVLAQAGSYTLMISCLTDYNLSIDLAVGPSYSMAETIDLELRKMIDGALTRQQIDDRKH